MVQWWQVINVDKRELSKHPYGEIGTWFFFPHEHILTHLSIPCLPREVDNWLSSGPHCEPRGPISKLPIDTLELIFEELRELHEAIYFAITCKLFLTVGKRHILRATRAHYATWAGCRLISLGDDTRLEDLPPALLTMSERHEIENTPLHNVGELWYDRTLSNFVNAAYKRVFELNARMGRVNKAVEYRHVLNRWRLDPGGARDPRVRADMRMFATLYGDGRRAAYPEGVRVLCNLSKGEYVRADGLHVPKYVNLVHALLARISWSSSPEVGMECGDTFREQLMCGPWAGDRFCVTSLEAIPETEDGGSWRDVTAEVDGLLTHIWENNSGRWIAFCRK